MDKEKLRAIYESGYYTIPVDTIDAFAKTIESKGFFERVWNNLKNIFKSESK